MEKISRTQKKKAAQARQKLGEKLVHLTNAQFETLDLPEELFEAVAMARQMKTHGAQRRQLQYVGRLMRQLDPTLVEAVIEKINAGEAERIRQFRLVERWRDELLSGNQERLLWLVERYPTIEPQELRGLVSRARGGHHHPKANYKKAARMLFRYLNAL